MLAFKLKSFKEPAETHEVEITTAHIIQLACYLTIFDERRGEMGGKNGLVPNKSMR